MHEIARRWLQFGPCANPTCTRGMWGEVGIIVTTVNGRNEPEYHNCCSAVCAEEFAQELAARLGNLPVNHCANPGCQGLVVGRGIRKIEDITRSGRIIYGHFCHKRCAERRWRDLKTEGKLSNPSRPHVTGNSRKAARWE